MPELVGEPMDAEREKQLRDWLKKSELKMLVTVLNAKSRLMQEQALKECEKANGENAYDLKSSASMRQAQRYQTALNVLSEIIDQAGPFEVVKLKS